MRSFRTVVGLLILCQAALAQTGRLTSGVPRRFTIPAQSFLFTLTGFSIAVPPGATRLTIDLAADTPANDLILWSRFDRDLAIDGGVVAGFDYSAQTIGSGNEQIVITAASTPPLQNGSYFIGIGVATLNTPISGRLTATVTGGGPGGTLVISTFERDTEDWGRNYPASLLPGASPEGDATSSLFRSNTGGNPGAYLQLTDLAAPLGADLQDYAVAPAKFLGNLGALTNGRLEFDFQHFNPGPSATFPVRVVIIGNDAAFQWVAGEPPEGGWIHYRIELNSNSLRRAAGLAPLATVLSNVERIEVSVDLAVSGVIETNGIDNFALISDPAPAPPGAFPIPAVPVISNFETGADGWSRNYPAAAAGGASIGDSRSTVSWSVDGGISGGGLKYEEAGSSADDFFAAPARYLGNLAAIPNPRLEFDYQHIGTPSGLNNVVVRLGGAGSTYVRQDTPPAPFNAWQHYRVPLAAAFFVRESGTATFAQVLAGVTRLEISSDQSDGAETNSLDNVQLFSAAAPPVQPQLGFSPASLTFTGVAGEANPAPQTLRIGSSGDNSPELGGPLSWTATLDPNATWATLSQTAGITPTVITISINTAGLAPRTYNAVLTVTGLGASNSPQNFPINLNVTISPAALPAIDAGGVVNAASFRAPIAAGSLATLFGRNLGGTEAGESTSFLSGQQLPRIFRNVRVVLRETGAELGTAPLLFVSNRQINFQMPYEMAGRTSVQIVVDNNGVQSAPETVALIPAAPGLFVYGSNRAVVQNQDSSLNSPDNAAARGSTIVAYLTGPGIVTPGVGTGQAAPDAPLSRVAATSSATIGGVPARVAFLGLSPGFVGLVQANIEIAAGTPAGEQLLQLTVGGQPANGAIVSIR